ncbi:MAG: hypothetical protein AAB289_17670, partial [Chloroflexota bacterium]
MIENIIIVAHRSVLGGRLAGFGCVLLGKSSQAGLIRVRCGQVLVHQDFRRRNVHDAGGIADQLRKAVVGVLGSGDEGAREVQLFEALGHQRRLLPGAGGEHQVA